MKIEYIRATICLFFICCVIKLHAQYISFENINHKTVQVNNWKYLRDVNVVKQNFDYSCGAASIATLLNNFYGQSLTEKDVLELLHSNNYLSFYDLQQILPQLGFIVISHQSNKIYYNQFFS